MADDMRREPSVPSSQADVLDETPERFDPAVLRGRLIEAEHVGRYHWASVLVRGKRVLDVGCGTAYGSTILAQAGAADVVGVDLDEETIDRAQTSVDEVVSLVAADARHLPFPDGSFDVVVCFELLEHVEEPEEVLDELVRVLTPGGIVVASSPNRAVYPPGNPHHWHEFRPEELTEAFARRLEHVRIVGQQDWLASSILADEDSARQSPRAEIRVLAPEEPGRELYSLVLASAAELPALPPYVVLTETADLKWWQERVQALQEDLRGSRYDAARAEDDREREKKHTRSLMKRLVALETQVAEAREAQALSESKAADSEEELKRTQEELKEELKRTQEELKEELKQREEQLAYVQATRAWRLAGVYWRTRDRMKRLFGFAR